MVNTKSPEPKAKTHRARTFFAAVFGTLAIWLVAASILVVWLNQTLLNNAVFSSTVAPLVSAPAVQNYVIATVSQQLENSAPPQQMAQSLLTNSQTTGQGPSAITTMIDSVVQSSVTSVVQSPTFAAQWKAVTTDAHQQFVTQLDSNTPTLSLNLHPAVADAVSDLGATKLGPVMTQFSVPATVGQVSLAGSGLDKIHLFVRILRTATIAIAGLAVLFLILAIWLSVHHIKTVKRILWATGTGEVGSAVLLSLLYVIKIKHGPPQQQAAFAIAQVLLRNLRLATGVIGIVCILAATIVHFATRKNEPQSTQNPTVAPVA